LDIGLARRFPKMELKFSVICPRVNWLMCKLLRNFYGLKFLETGPNAIVRKTVSPGFDEVIDRSHAVNQGPIPIQFYVDERKQLGGITVADELFRHDMCDMQELPPAGKILPCMTLPHVHESTHFQ
jgi:hypothetical protein